MFTSINSDATPFFEDAYQRPQNTSNCFAKKAQSCELYELGRSTYKKLRLAILKEHRKKLIEDATQKISLDDNSSLQYLPSIYKKMVEEQKSQILSPKELLVLSNSLSELKSPPSPQYYERFFKDLLQAKNTLLALNDTPQVENVDANNIAIDRIDNKLNQHSQEFYEYLKSENTNETNALITKCFIKSANDDGYILKGSDDSFDDEALIELSKFSAAKSWQAIINMIDHQIVKLDVKERYLNNENERLDQVSSSTAIASVTFDDLKNASVVRFNSGWFRTSTIKVEVDIKGERKEIDVDSFLELTLKYENKDSLTDPSIMGLLDYLRNASPSIEKKYQSKIYEKQLKAFKVKLNENIQSAKSNYHITNAQLATRTDNLTLVTKDIENSIKDITHKIKDELRKANQDLSITDLQKLKSDREVSIKAIEKINTTIKYDKKKLKTAVAKLNKINTLIKTTVLFDNLEQQKKLLENDLKNTEKCIVSINSEVVSLRETLKRTMSQVDEMFMELQHDSENSSINDVCRLFVSGQECLAENKKERQKSIHKVEVENVRELMSQRSEAVDLFRLEVIHNHLTTNSEFQILHDLALGNMGLEKNRNPNMYQLDIEQPKGKMFLKDSVSYKIQYLNKQLCSQVEAIVHQKQLHKELQRELKGDFLSYKVEGAEIKNENPNYEKIDLDSKEISAEPISQDIKQNWVDEMFSIWLAHTDVEKRYELEQKDYVKGVNQSFQQFIEQKANVKYGALIAAKFPIKFDAAKLLKMGYQKVTLDDVDNYKAKQKNIANMIGDKRRKVLDKRTIPITNETQEEESVLNSESLTSKPKDKVNVQQFVKPDVEYFKTENEMGIDGSTLDFLRNNKCPQVPDNQAPNSLNDFYNSAMIYLAEVKDFNGLENKPERVRELCYKLSNNVFQLPMHSNTTLTEDLTETLIESYRDDDGLIDENIKKLENTERNQFLTALIKIELSKLDESVTSIDSNFYSIIKHWQKLISPKDIDLSNVISKLSAGGNQPINFMLIKEVDLAIQKSPIGLEGIYEGQKGLQVALNNLAGEQGINPQEVRQLADRLHMRNGDALLAHQFMSFYSKSELLNSSSGLKSTQGRELFSRAFLDAFENSLPAERLELLTFMKTLPISPQENVSNLISSDEVFLDELLTRCSADYKLQSHQPTEVKDFIIELTNTDSEDGTRRLFGFAKEINILSLEIKQELNKAPMQLNKLDELRARLICSNLAYHSLLEQIGEERTENLNDNFEFVREMALAKANIINSQEMLVNYSANLNDDSSFLSIFKEYIRDKKFDGPAQVASIAQSIKDLDGFINLGNGRSLDVIHGAVYQGNNRLGLMPLHIQSHIALNELGLNGTLFRSENDGFAYREGNDLIGFIMQKTDGELIIQRQLSTIDGTTKLLQNISSEKMSTLPKVFTRRMAVEHFFIDKDENIHGFTSDFKPVLEIKQQAGLWQGKMVDAFNVEQVINLNNLNQDLSNELSTVFPQDEMIQISDSIIYIAALAQYIIKDGADLFMSESPAIGSTRKSFSITPQGSIVLSNKLTAEQNKIVSKIDTDIIKLESELANIIGKGIVSNHKRSQKELEISQKQAELAEINGEEYLVFEANEKILVAAETNYDSCRVEMATAYKTLQEEGTGAQAYNEAKLKYQESKSALNKIYNSDSPLISFYNKNGILQANNFKSILYLAKLPDQEKFLSQLLSENALQKPLSSNELITLKFIVESFKDNNQHSNEETLANIMLVATELQHHVLERSACANGQLSTWDEKSYKDLKTKFEEQVKSLNNQSPDFPLEQILNIWRYIESEFSDDNLSQILTEKIELIETDAKKPISINSKTTNMPIETMAARTLVEFEPYSDLDSIIDKSQIKLEKNLEKLSNNSDSISEQRDGYYYENYGIRYKLVG